MTTTVKVTTHGWPVRVITTDRYQTDNSGVLHRESRDLPRWSETELHIHSTRSIELEELEGWEDKPAEILSAQAD